MVACPSEARCVGAARIAETALLQFLVEFEKLLSEGLIKDSHSVDWVSNTCSAEREQ